MKQHAEYGWRSWEKRRSVQVFFGWEIVQVNECIMVSSNSVDIYTMEPDLVDLTEIEFLDHTYLQIKFHNVPKRIFYLEVSQEHIKQMVETWGKKVNPD